MFRGSVGGCFLPLFRAVVRVDIQLEYCKVTKHLRKMQDISCRLRFSGVKLYYECLFALYVNNTYLCTLYQQQKRLPGCRLVLPGDKETTNKNLYHV